MCDGRLINLAGSISTAHDQAIVKMKAALEDETDYQAHIVAAAELIPLARLMQDAADMNAWEEAEPEEA